LPQCRAQSIRHNARGDVDASGRDGTVIFTGRDCALAEVATAAQKSAVPIANEMLRLGIVISLLEISPSITELGASLPPMSAPG
jgi:hypothetical protein